MGRNGRREFVDKPQEHASEFQKRSGVLRLHKFNLVSRLVAALPNLVDPALCLNTGAL